MYGLDGLLNEKRSISGSFLRLFGQVSDFIGNNGKSLTGRAGTSRLDCRIERKDICLESDIVNGLDDFLNFVGLVNDIVHCSRHFGHLIVGKLHGSAGLCAELRSFFGLICCFADLDRNLIHGSGQFLYRGCLLSRTLCQSLGTGRYLIGVGGNLYGCVLNVAHSGVKILADFLKGFQKRCIRTNVTVVVIEIYVEISLGKLCQLILEIVDDTLNAADDMLDGTCHGTDFVSSCVIQLDIEVTICNFFHCSANAL